MKESIKKNAFWLIGEFFIFVVPVIMLIILACESKDSKVAVSLWGVVVAVVIVIIYYFMGRKVLNKKKEKDYDKKGYVPTWIRVLGLFVAMLPFVALLLVLYSTKTMLDEIIVYIICTMVSIGVGYIFLIVDSAKKSKTE